MRPPTAFSEPLEFRWSAAGPPPWRSRSSWRLRCCSPIRRPGVAELGAGPIVFAIAALAAAVDCLRLPQWRGSGAVVAVRPAASLIVAAEPQSRPRHPGDDHGIPAAERRTPRPPTVIVRTLPNRGGDRRRETPVPAATTRRRSRDPGRGPAHPAPPDGDRPHSADPAVIVAAEPRSRPRQPGDDHGSGRGPARPATPVVIVRALPIRAVSLAGRTDCPTIGSQVGSAGSKVGSAGCRAGSAGSPGGSPGSCGAAVRLAPDGDSAIGSASAVSLAGGGSNQSRVSSRRPIRAFHRGRPVGPRSTRRGIQA